MVHLNPLSSNKNIMKTVADLVGGKEEHVWVAGSPREGTEQHLFFRPVSRLWNDVWGVRSRYTRAVTVDTTPSQLVGCLKGGLSLYGATRACAKLGSLRLLQALQTQGYHLDMGTMCDGAAGEGRIDLLLWARDNGFAWGKTTVDSAASGGKIGVLQFLWAEGCSELYTSSACAMAACGGKLEALKWLYGKGCPWVASTCTAAARGGHLEVIQWARQNGCPWSTWTSAAAAQGGHLPTLVWLYGNGCPWNWGVVMEEARCEDHEDVVEWARECQEESDY